MRSYPQTYNLSNIRFTAEELDGYILNAANIIRKYIEKNECPWMYLRDNLEYGDINQFTKNVFITIFGNQIMEPLEDLDLRFELDTASGNYHATAVMKALKGEVNLVSIRPSSTRSFKDRNFRVDDVNIIMLSNVVNALNSMIGRDVRYTRNNDEDGLLYNPTIFEIVED